MAAVHHPKPIGQSCVHWQPTPTEEATRLAAAADLGYTWNWAPGPTEDAGRHRSEWLQ